MSGPRWAVSRNRDTRRWTAVAPAGRVFDRFPSHTAALRFAVALADLQPVLTKIRAGR